MNTHDVDRAVEKIARRQHFAFSRTQVVECGASSDMIDHRLQTGTWVRLEASVYALACGPPTYLRQYKAAELGSPGAAVAGLAAAVLHGLPDFRTVRPEIIRPPHTNNRSQLATVHRSIYIETTTVKGIRVTSLRQTLFDVARQGRLDRLERAVDDALLTNRLTLDDLDDWLAVLGNTRKPSLPTMRALIAERRADGWAAPESELEAVLLRVLARLPSRPALLRQAPLPWRPAERGRVDVLIPTWQTIVEADGRRWHARVGDFDADRWRDAQAVANGYRVLRFTWLHLTQRADEVVELVEQTGRVARGAAA